MRLFIRILFVLLPAYSAAQCQLPERFIMFRPPMSAEKLPITSNHSLYIVNLWAVWCAPCRKELPILAELNQQIPVHLLNIGDSPERTQDFLNSIGINDLPQSHTEGSELLQLLKAVGLPLTLLIQNGQIIYKLQGLFRPSDRDALIAYNACLRKKPSHSTIQE